MMIREIIFIFVLFFITGCGMSGSKTEDNSKEISLVDSGASSDLNTTDFGTQIATTESKEAILPQTFSIAFPAILKKSSNEYNFSNTVLENNETEDLNNSVSDSNSTNSLNSAVSENNQSEETNNTISDNTQIIDLNSSLSDNNQTEDIENSVSDSNLTDELNCTITDNNQTMEVDLNVSDSNLTDEFNSTVDTNKTIEYCDENSIIDDNQTATQTSNIAYNSLTDKVEKIERVIKISQVNLTVLEETMPKILSTCEGIELNTTCLFEEGELFVPMDNRTRKEISSIIDENNITFPDINESGLSLGEVTYKKYNDDILYEYGLSHEMSAKESNCSKKEQYIFKWSDNNQDTLTQYSYEDNITLSNVSIHYLKGEEEKELMHVTFTNNNIILGKKEIMNLTLVKKGGDENGSYSITSNSIEEFKDGNETNTSRFSSNGDISEESTLLLFSGTISTENNSTDKETTTTLQDNRVRCNTENSDESDIELYELNVTEANLTNGEYLIFEPDTVIKELSSLEIYEQSIGSFTVDEDKIQGSIHGDAYDEVLNDLIIIRLKESQESTDIFEIINKEERPNLKIIKY